MNVLLFLETIATLILVDLRGLVKITFFCHLKTSVNSKLIGVGCPAHVFHNCIQNGVDTLPIVNASTNAISKHVTTAQYV